MTLKAIEIGEEKKPRAISIVDFPGQGWDIVEYEGASKFKIAEIPPIIPLDKMPEADVQKFILTLLDIYTERLSPGLPAKALSRKEVIEVFTRISVPVSSRPS